MNVVFVFISSLFFLWVIREVFFWITIWQTNGYRPDRFFTFLKKKHHKIISLLSLVHIAKWILFFSFALVIFNDDWLNPYQYCVIFLYLVQAFIIGKEIYANHLKKPLLTIRATLLIVLTLLIVFLFFAVPLMDKFFWLVFIDLLIPVFVSSFVFLFLFPVELYTDWQAEKALKKIRAHKKLLVIGVTGSHGKSAVKDSIASLLAYKFSVIKTEGKDNTAGGIARTILKKLEDDTEIFVAELSAYKRGEILALCRFIHPNIGVITGVNNQYLSLFNGLENIKRTNYELVEGLPKNGLCLFNGTNKNTHGIYQKTKKKKVLYTLAEKEPSGGNVFIARKITRAAKQISFDVQFGKKISHFTVPESVNIEHLLPALYLARHLGMKEREIKKAVAALK